MQRAWASLSAAFDAPTASKLSEPTVHPRQVLNVNELYREYAPQVARWAERWLGPSSDLEDVVHDVFLVAHRRRNEWRGDAQTTTWLYEITLRVTQARRRARR